MVDPNYIAGTMALLPLTSFVTPLQAVTDTLVAITAFLGTLGAIYTLLKHLSQRRNKPKEASSLQFVHVQHQPVEWAKWQQRRRLSFAVAAGCLCALVGYSLLLFLAFPPRSGEWGRVGVYLVFVGVLVFNLLAWFSVYTKLGKTPEQARTYFFQGATVEVDAPLETIFAECLRAVKRLNAYALEFDVTQRHLEATLGRSLNSLGGTLCIKIEPGNEHHFVIQVDLERRYVHRLFAHSSWGITSFIRQLLGK
jgi:hypothetical protein